MTIPPALELAASCAELIRSWHHREPPLDWDTVAQTFAPTDHDWNGSVADLCLVNCFQWHLEDECRARYDDAHALAALKRSIDDSNRRRVGRIDAIDERASRELGYGTGRDGSVPVVLVTPGNLLDRISILELKRYHAASRHELEARLEEELDDACRGLDRLVDDLTSSRQVLKLYRTVKLYGTTESGAGCDM